MTRVVFAVATVGDPVPSLVCGIGVHGGSDGTGEGALYADISQSDRNLEFDRHDEAKAVCSWLNRAIEGTWYQVVKALARDTDDDDDGDEEAE
jgi:hypothetical protein